MILLYAFSNPWGTNISRRTFSDLQKQINNFQNIRYQTIFGHPRTFFQKYIPNDSYDLIIGLGDGGDRLQKISIETIATNRYGHQPIYEFSPFKLELSLPTLDLVDSSNFQISEFMGTYNCNFMAYSIQNHINQHKLSTQQLFFRLPKRATSALLAFQLANLLTANQIIK